MYPEDKQEFARCWSSKAGEVVGVKRCIVEVDQRAQQAFIQGQDAVAHAMRDLSRLLMGMAKKLAVDLDGFIKEDSSRRYEEMKPLRH